MKRIISFVSVIGLLSISQFVYSDSITDTYSTGDTLTATTLNNIKSAVNDNDARTTSLENSQTVQDTDIGTLESDQQALQTNDAAQDTRLDALEAADLINRITALENALTAHIADLANPHAVSKTQIGLANLEDIRVNYTATTAPTVTDDINSGYSVGSVWIDVAQDQAYVLVDSTSGTAAWKSITNTNKFYAIGDTGPAGGIVFYISDGGLHGLEASLADQSATAEWGCNGTWMSASSDLYPLDLKPIGMGVPNTIDIVTGCPTAGIAARLADDFELNGYTDWFLPSKAELDFLYSRQTIVGGFANSAYWSSSEDSSSVAWFKHFGTGHQNKSVKTGLIAVRAIRAF